MLSVQGRIEGSLEASMDRAGAPAELAYAMAEVLQCVIHHELLPTVDGGKRVACEILVATRAVRSQIRGSNEVMLRSSIMSGRDLGMQTMNASLDSLLADAAITDGVYENVLKNYASFS